jgi:hypothetical protein
VILPRSAQLKGACPLCGGASLEGLLERREVPVLLNRFYDNAAAAQHASRGRLSTVRELRLRVQPRVRANLSFTTLPTRTISQTRPPSLCICRKWPSAFWSARKIVRRPEWSRSVVAKDDSWKCWSNTAVRESQMRSVTIRHGAADRFQTGYISSRGSLTRMTCALNRPQLTPLSRVTSSTLARAKTIQRRERDFVASWQARLAKLKTEGNIAIWGAGAKGVTFIDTVDRGTKWITCLSGKTGSVYSDHFVSGLQFPGGDTTWRNEDHRHESKLPRRDRGLSWTDVNFGSAVRCSKPEC